MKIDKDRVDDLWDLIIIGSAILLGYLIFEGVTEALTMPAPIECSAIPYVVGERPSCVIV